MKKKKEKSEELRKKRLQVMWGVFISIMFVLGSLSYWVSNKNTNTLNSFDYNGYKFTYAKNQIYTKINDATLKFFITPYKAEEFNISKEAIKKIKNANKVIISVDPSSKFLDTLGLASFYLQTDFSSIGKNVEIAALKNNDLGYKVVNCNNISKNEFLVALIDGSQTNVRETKENCLSLIANGPMDYLVLRDALAYRLYGIIK